MNKELVYFFGIIATGATLCGAMLASGALTALGASMFLLPLFIGLTGDKYF